MAETFAEKLTFVLGALSISRGRLAADLGVDKSVVSRWLSGAGGPTSHNLSRITAIVAGRVPGFTMLDWDAPIAALAPRVRPGPVDDPARPLAFPLIERSTAEIAAAGDRYCGLWRATRVSILTPGAFIREHWLISPRGGQLTVRVFTDRYDWPGWALLVRGRLDILYGDDDLSHAMLAPPDTPVVDAMDGLLLTPTADAFRGPAAAVLMLERTTPPGLTDPEAPALAAAIDAAKALSPFADEAEVGPDLAAHLRREAGRDERSPYLMALAEARSLGRGRWF